MEMAIVFVCCFGEEGKSRFPTCLLAVGNGFMGAVIFQNAKVITHRAEEVCSFPVNLPCIIFV
jgi:hypothetical protein